MDPGAEYNNVALSPDGARLTVAVWPPGGVRTYDMTTGELTGSVDGVGGRMALSPDGTVIAVTGLEDGQIASARRGDACRARTIDRADVDRVRLAGLLPRRDTSGSARPRFRRHLRVGCRDRRRRRRARRPDRLRHRALVRRDDGTVHATTDDGARLAVGSARRPPLHLPGRGADRPRPG